MTGVRRTFLGAAIGLLALPAGATAQAVISRDLTGTPPRIVYTGEAATPNTVGCRPAARSRSAASGPAGAVAAPPGRA